MNIIKKNFILSCMTLVFSGVCIADNVELSDIEEYPQSKHHNLKEVPLFSEEYEAGRYLNLPKIEREKRLSLLSQGDKRKLFLAIRSLNSLNTGFSEDYIYNESFHLFKDLKNNHFDKNYVIYNNGDFKIFQRDSIINLEAVNYFDTGNKINKHALKYGMSPVGDDGRKIKVCKLSSLDSAEYFELNDYQVSSFNASFNVYGGEYYCLSEEQLSSYWKSRLSELIKDNGDYTKRYLDSRDG